MKTSMRWLLAGLFFTALLINDGAEVETEKTVPENAETHEFQAEVNRLMDILINSLYSNKDIFLRELISNASDAIDKIRFLMISDPSIQEDDDNDLEIQIVPDAEKRTLTIRDFGVGMTKDDLIKNLGTVAHSGTTKFMEAMKAGEDGSGLIGQFGVGFYSAFLVADKVTVTTKHINDTQFVWESDAKSSFQIYPDTSGSLGKHGSAVTLHLKEDASDYLDEAKLKAIIQKYSRFIDFPIMLRTSKTVKEEVAVEAEKTAEGEAEPKKDEDELDVTDEEEPAKKETVERVVLDWERMNENKPLWTRSPSDVSEEEYNDFFKALSSSSDDPLKHIHFKAEGQVQFRGLIYIPKKAPSDLYDKYYNEKNDALKLYVRRVLLASELDDDFLPQYLSFVKGVIDADDLPINVSRETLQKNRSIKIIGRNIVSRIIKMIQALADAKEEEDEKEDEENKDEEKAESPYEQFWNQFGRSIKLGVLKSDKNKDKLIDLLRFTSTKSPKKLISLAEYVERMPEKQKQIYYISGQDQASVENSPMLEQLKRRDYEVLFFVDNLDEYLVANIPKYEDKELFSVAKEGLKFGDESEEEEEIQKDLDVDFKPLLEWMKEVLGEKVGSVVVSRRIADSPAVLVSSRWGWSANMERIMRAQAMSQQFEQQKFMMGSRTLEINPDHPIVQELKKRVSSDEKDAVADVVRLLYDSALINSGFSHGDLPDFIKRVNGIMASNLNVDANPSGDRYVPPKRPVEEKTEDENVADDVEADEEDLKDEL